MKKILSLLSLFTALAASAQSTDAQLTTQANAIRNTTTAGAITKTMIADMHQAIIDSKISENLARNRVTTNYTLALTDNFKLVEMNSASTQTITVPPNSSVAFTADFTQISIARYGTGAVNVVAGSGVTIRSADGALSLRAQYSSAVLIKIGTNEWYLIGDIQ